jgi:hypothetical protein
MRIPIIDRLTIAGKVYALLGACVTLAGTVAVLEFSNMTRDYKEYAAQADFQDQTRVAQVTFKKQVQAWKNRRRSRFDGQSAPGGEAGRRDRQDADRVPVRAREDA